MRATFEISNSSNVPFWGIYGIFLLLVDRGRCCRCDQTTQKWLKCRFLNTVLWGSSVIRDIKCARLFSNLFLATFNARDLFQKWKSRLSRHFMRATFYAFKVLPHKITTQETNISHYTSPPTKNISTIFLREGNWTGVGHNNNNNNNNNNNITLSNM